MNDVARSMKDVESLVFKAWSKRLLKRYQLEAEVRKPRPGETDEQAQVRFWAVCRTGPAMASIGMSTILDENEHTVRFEKAGDEGPTLTVIRKKKEDVT